MITIGALPRLEDIATNDIAERDFHALVEAALRTASTYPREIVPLQATSVGTWVLLLAYRAVSPKNAITFGTPLT